MPRYELMYILASSVSDDIVESTSKEIEQFVADFGGEQIEHELMGKKKLAYTIKKTRNGHYGLITFDMPSTQLAPLDAKLRTQQNTIIRYIIVNIDEHLARMAKDTIVQTKMNQARDADKARAAEAGEESASDRFKSTPEPSKKTPKPTKKPVSSKKIDEEIEKALTEDLTI